MRSFEQEKTERTELGVPWIDDAVEVFCCRLRGSPFLFVSISTPRTALFPLLLSVQKSTFLLSRRKRGERSWVCLGWMTRLKCFAVGFEVPHSYLCQFPNREPLCFLCCLLFKIAQVKKCAIKNGDAENNVAILNFTLPTRERCVAVLLSG